MVVQVPSEWLDPDADQDMDGHMAERGARRATQTADGGRR
jgi:hypothetical protein